jgi:hypothetical protein
MKKEGESHLPAAPAGGLCPDNGPIPATPPFESKFIWTVW